MTPNLYAANTPAAFWRLLVHPEPTPDEWAVAAHTAAQVLLPATRSAGLDIETLFASTLGEEQFGSWHWRLSWTKRWYYRLRPILPRLLMMPLRRGYRRRQEGAHQLNWPIENRFAKFLCGCAANLLRARECEAAPYINLWPNGYKFAFVLTHDVETAAGCDFVRAVADLEEQLGFRSSFNFVPELYCVDPKLLDELRARGFEVGVHGLKHDGRLFESRAEFERRARKINHYLHEWSAVGFRAPFTHRQPEWMQALEIEYDLSFFDTDPYETIPGGTMSLWPFFIGRFVELPYTLVQDHTLMVILGESTPRIWLDKVDFLAQWGGMALLNSHPDYLRAPGGLAFYEQFLRAMAGRRDAWVALPRDVARWWRQRATFQPLWRDEQWDLSGLPGATPCELRVSDVAFFDSPTPQEAYDCFQR